MSRDRQTLLVLLLAALYALAVKLAEDRGYIPVGYNWVNYIVSAIVLIYLAIQVRRGRLTLPAGFLTKRARGPILFGLALVLASIAWLLGGIMLFGGNTSYGTLIPFFVLLLSGLMIVGAGLWYKLVQLMMGKRN